MPGSSVQCVPPTDETEGAATKMDQMYRWTRHVYDVTRRYYLLGRDRMLDRIANRPPGRVLEVGCGTARNLRLLHRKAPHHALYGLDASLAMLATARAALDRDGCHDQVTLGQGLAQELRPSDQLGTEGPFDVIFFSYALSMIPPWPEALERALTHLASDGRLYVADFWDQADLPSWVASGLQRWLALFDVTPRPNLLRTLRCLDEEGRLSCSIDSVGRRYAYLATVELNDRGGVGAAPPVSEIYRSLDQPASRRTVVS